MQPVNPQRILVSSLVLLAAALIAPENVVIANAPPTGVTTTQTLMNVSAGAGLPLTAATLYSSLMGNGTGDVPWITTIESTRGSLLPAGTLNALRFTTSYDTPGFDVGDAGDNVIATVMKNGVATALSCTVNGVTGAANKEEQCGSVPAVVDPPVTVAQGDRLTLRIETVGTPATNGMATWSVDFTPATPNTTAMAGMHSTVTTARWLPPGVSSHGTGAFASGASDIEGRVYVPTAGNITGVLCRSDSRRAVSVKVEVIINGTRDATLDCMVTRADDMNPVLTAATRSLAAGDTVSLRYAGDSASGFLFATLLFEPTATGQWWVGSSSGPAVAYGSANVLMPLAGYRGTSCPRNHACSWWPPPNVNIEAVRVDLGTPPTGAQALRVFVARHIEDPPSAGSTIETALSCAFGAGVSSTCVDTDASSVDAVHDDDYWQIASIPSGGPNATSLKVSTIFSRD